MRPRFFVLAGLVAGTLTACREPRQGGGAPCGIAALAGPVTLLDQFQVPRQTLSEPPRRLPPRVVARLAAGPAFPSEVGRTDSTVVIGVNGTLPANVTPGYGVLVVDPSDSVRGVVVYEGVPIEGAPQIGVVNIGAASVPLLGIQLTMSRIEQPNCPLFPDSILQ